MANGNRAARRSGVSRPGIYKALGEDGIQACPGLDPGFETIRSILGAMGLKVPVATVRDWEQHRRSPDAPARTLLGIVDADPKAAMALIERVVH